MFSFFRKKETGPTVNDIVFATSKAKWHALAELARPDATIVFVAWFDESREQLERYFEMRNIASKVSMYREAGGEANSTNIFIEHYPLAEKEKTAFHSLAQRRVDVYSSLDEPMFRQFGADKIASMLSKMGLQENEAISHPMITKSIRNIQQKIASKVLIDQSARSMQEWMQKNVGTTPH